MTVPYYKAYNTPQQPHKTPMPQQVVHSYTTRAPNLLSFKSNKEKPMAEFNSKFKGYYEKYTSELGSTQTKFNPEAPLYLGIELEYEVGDKEAGLVSVMTHLADHVIVKSDGSLRNGFELVSCPATIDIHKEEFKKFFDEFPVSNLKAESTCGLHVHVSREPIALSTQGRMIAFMNNEHNKAFIEDIAGRKFNNYSKQDASRKLTTILRNGNTERYNVLNTNNKDTLEFRIFASTTNYEQLVEALEFCVAVVEYCKPCSTGRSLAEFVKHESFVEWLGKNKSDFSQLAKKYYKTKPLTKFQQSLQGQL